MPFPVALTTVEGSRAWVEVAAANQILQLHLQAWNLIRSARAHTHMHTETRVHTRILTLTTVQFASPERARCGCPLLQSAVFPAFTFWFLFLKIWAKYMRTVTRVKLVELKTIKLVKECKSKRKNWFLLFGFCFGNRFLLLSLFW